MSKKKIFGTILIVLTLIFTCVSVFVSGNTAAAYAVKGASVYLVDFETGTVLKENNATDRRPIASMVKIMTLLLSYEAMARGEIAAQQEVVVSDEASGMGGSQMFLEAGDTYTIGELLKGITVVSANDAAVQMAQILAGDVGAFIAKMNERAAALGMVDTKFCNVTGLPDAGEQYSTAKDVTLMMRELLKHEEYFCYSKTFLEDYTHPDGRVTQFVNTNKLVRFYQGCDAGKTGFTNEAMFCLSASAIKNNLRVVATVVGAETSKARFAAVTEMFNYAFNNYEQRKVLTEDLIENHITIENGKTETICIRAEKSVSLLVKKGENINYKLNVTIPETLSAPIAVGDVIGTVQVLDGAGNVVEEVNIVSETEVQKSGYWDAIKKVLKHWLILRLN